MSDQWHTITTPDGTAEAYVARPSAEDDRAIDHSGVSNPGVLLFIDAIGVRPQIISMADRIASWGYVVLVPNVLYRSGTIAQTSPDVPYLDAEARAAFLGAAMPRVHALTDDQVMSDGTAYIAALHALPGVGAGPVGLTGYCMGGRLALLTAATHPDDVAAVGMFHTGGLVTDSASSPHLRVAEVHAALLAIHADHDRSLPPEAVAQFEHALTAAGVTHHTRVYPGAQHGYTMADTSIYNHDASEYHFTELREEFARTLG